MTKLFNAKFLRDDVLDSIQIEFVVPVADGAPRAIVVPNSATIGQKAAAIRTVTSTLPSAGLHALIRTAELQGGAPIPCSSTTGWKLSNDRQLAAFSLPGRIIETQPLGRRWSGSVRHPLSRIGEAKGNQEAFVTGLISLSRASSFVAFAAMAALAGPLRRFVDLPESPVFSFCGPSSVGKTTLLRVAAAMQGAPEAMGSWNTTARALEEDGAVCNDLALLLNAAESCPLPRLPEIFQMVVHTIPDGASSARSQGVQDRFQNLAWSGVTLSTSNTSGQELAGRLKRPWEPQDEVRLLDIPVPPADQGGIFDRLDADDGPVQMQAQRRLDEIETLLGAHYGVLIEPWTRYLATIDARSRAAELIDCFVRRVGKPSGLERRIARKFGLVYAAGEMANEAGILGWPKNRPFYSVRRLYRLARSARKTGHIPESVKDFAQRLQDRRTVPKVRHGKAFVEDRLFAIRTKHLQQQVYGIRLRDLQVLGVAESQSVVAWLRTSGVALPGQGGKSTCQVPVDIKVGTQTIRRPRMLLVDVERLKQAIS